MTTRCPTILQGVICAAAGLLIGGCASVPPTGEVDPAHAPSAEMPLEWFAENWGPFDASLNARTADGRGRPLLLIDGHQVRNGGEVEEPGTPLARHDAAHILRDLEPEDVAKVKVFRCAAWLFGDAGNRGVIMIFTTNYEGPLPVDDDKPRDPEECRSRG